MPEVTISLPEALKDFAEAQMDAQGYRSMSDYVGSLLQAAQEKEQDERLQGLLLEGLSSGKAVPIDDTFWRKLRADAEEGSQDRTARTKPA
jgi:antitoxin ParD1/3/4